MLNLFQVRPGQIVRLKDDSTCEVVSNIGDGIWLSVRTSDRSKLSTTDDQERLVHCEEIVELIDIV